MDNKHINFVKKIEYRTCPDILVGHDKEFWFSKKERIKHKNELNIFDSLKTRKKDELIIVIILESPHISEFSTKREDDFFDDKILANPALGKTGNNLQKYFTHNNLNNLIEKYYCEKDCNIKIINCYEVKQSEDLDKIIKENGYTQILNTKGECDIKKIVL